MIAEDLFENVIAQWLEDLKADRAATTVTRYASIAQRLIAWYKAETGQPLTLAEVNPILLVGYRNALQQTEQPSTVNTHVSALRSLGRWLKQHGLVDDDPCARLKLVKRQTPGAPRALT